MDYENYQTRNTLNSPNCSNLTRETLFETNYDSDNSTDSKYSDYTNFFNVDLLRTKKVKLDESQFRNTEDSNLVGQLSEQPIIDQSSTDHSEFEEDTNNSISLSCNSHIRSKLKRPLSSRENLQVATQSNLNKPDNLLNERLLAMTKDTSLIYCGAPLQFNSSIISEKKELIKAKIEVILHELLTRFSNGNSKIFKLFAANWLNCSQQNNVLQPKPNFKEKKVCFTVNSTRSSLIIDLLHKISSLIENNSVCTQREIYYQLKSRVKYQKVIADSMSLISSIINVEPWYFPITTTSTGLFFGNLTMIDANGEVVTYKNNQKENLVPENILEIKDFRSDAAFILLVEKDAIFKKLIDEDVATKLTLPFILITGKGCPDIKTRLFARRLWMSLNIPIFALVDGDPYGIDIMLTYRFGSLTSALWNKDLAIPNLKWLGILPSEMASLNIAGEKLNQKDIMRIKYMLKRPYIEENPWLKKELEIMLKNGIKTEIEGVIKTHNNLTNFYLIGKFYTGDFF